MCVVIVEATLDETSFDCESLDCDRLLDSPLSDGRGGRLIEGEGLPLDRFDEDPVLRTDMSAGSGGNALVEFLDGRRDDGAEDLPPLLLL